MSIKDFGKEDVLGAFGLESRKQAYQYILPAVGILAAGILVGAGLGLLLAPKPGRELRADIKDKVLRMKPDESGDETDKFEAGRSGQAAIKGRGMHQADESKSDKTNGSNAGVSSPSVPHRT